MKVKELKKRLEEMNDDLDVVLVNEEGLGSVVGWKLLDVYEGNRKDCILYSDEIIEEN